MHLKINNRFHWKLNYFWRMNNRLKPESGLDNMLKKNKKD